MPDVIAADGTIRNDDWVVVPRPAAGESMDIPEDKPVLIPADLWLAGHEHFAGKPSVGVWFEWGVYRCCSLIHECDCRPGRIEKPK